MKHIRKDYTELEKVEANEVFKLGNFRTRFKCIEYPNIENSCNRCIFDVLDNCDGIPCEDIEREDKKNVIFIDEIPKNQIPLFDDF
jgi:hypothetical protein